MFEKGRGGGVNPSQVEVSGTERVGRSQSLVETSLLSLEQEGHPKWAGLCVSCECQTRHSSRQLGYPSWPQLTWTLVGVQPGTEGSQQADPCNVRMGREGKGSSLGRAWRISSEQRPVKLVLKGQAGAQQVRRRRRGWRKKRGGRGVTPRQVEVLGAERVVRGQSDHWAALGVIGSGLSRSSEPPLWRQGRGGAAYRSSDRVASQSSRRMRGGVEDQLVQRLLVANLTAFWHLRRMGGKEAGR